jgi:hypothetical protein
VIVPTGVSFEKINNIALPKEKVGASFKANVFLLPKYVSFQYLLVREGTCKAKTDGSQSVYVGSVHQATKDIPTARNGNIDKGCFLTTDTLSIQRLLGHPFEGVY